MATISTVSASGASALDSASARGLQRPAVVAIDVNAVKKAVRVKVRHGAKQVVAIAWGDGNHTNRLGCRPRSKATCTTALPHNFSESGRYTVIVSVAGKTIGERTVQFGQPEASGPTSVETATPTPFEAAPPTPAVPASWAEDMLNAVNREREKNGVAPLRMCAPIERAAQKFADYMSSTNTYGHDADGQRPHERIEAEGYGAYVSTAENIAAGQKTVDQVVAQWIASPGHYTNLMNPKYTDVGFGYTENPNNSPWKTRWVQNFGGRGTC